MPQTHVGFEKLFLNGLAYDSFIFNEFKQFLLGLFNRLTEFEQNLIHMFMIVYRSFKIYLFKIFLLYIFIILFIIYLIYFYYLFILINILNIY